MNFVGVVAAAVASIVIGMIWYSPAVFGKKFMALSKMSEKSMKGANMGVLLVQQFVASLVMAFVLAILVGLGGATTLVAGATMGFWAWLGFVATSSYSSVLWGGKSRELWMLNNACDLVTLAVMGAIIAVVV